MKTPLQIVFRNLERSDSLEAAIKERVEKLERFSDHIIRCKVTVEAPHKHHAQGNVYHVAIHLHVPGKEILVNRDPNENHAHEDVYVAIRDAFNAASRQLEDYIRISRGKTKAHETPLHGRISEVHPERDFGLITTPEGRQIYFHRNCILDAKLEDLSPGTEVRFDEEPGNEGPQATSLRVIGKHHIV
jgi:ribosomal subunit interface protein